MITSYDALSSVRLTAIALSLLKTLRLKVKIDYLT